MASTSTLPQTKAQRQNLNNNHKPFQGFLRLVVVEAAKQQINEKGKDNEIPCMCVCRRQLQGTVLLREPKNAADT